MRGIVSSGIILVISLSLVPYSRAGEYWHVTDFHWDPSYSVNASGDSCNANKQGRLGRLGSYLCDAPWRLINSSVHAMRHIRSRPDFIVWTGDDTPHVKPDKLDNNATLAIIQQLTELLYRVFPDTPVYPALGNHDSYPKHQFPPHNNSLYDFVAGIWNVWINETQAMNDFKKGAYYTLKHPGSKLRLVVLNTNLYYVSNKLTNGMDDPAGQFAWMERVLHKAKTAGEKVHVIGHVPPGMFEKHRYKYWFYPKFNTRFIQILQRYFDVISAMNFAHHHTDSFRLVRQSDGRSVGSMLLAPSVTPWETTLPGVIGSAANNPAIRLVQYSNQDGRLQDLHQYFLNLTEANDLNEDTWKLEYKATEKFKIPDIGTQSLDKLAQSFRNTRGTNQEFRNYLDINGVAINPGEKCDDECRRVHICSILELDYGKYQNCMTSSAPVINNGAVLSVLFLWALVKSIS